MIEPKALTTTVLYQWPKNEPKPQAGSIELIKFLSKDTGWATAVVTGPDSVIEPGDPILLSRRVVSADFEINGETMHNTSDNSCLAYRRGTELRATGKTMLYSWIEDEQEEVTESGIVLLKANKTKEFEPKWALVHAAGEQTGVKAGDHVLLMYKLDNYHIDIDGIQMRNAGVEEIITFYTPKE